MKNKALVIAMLLLVSGCTASGNKEGAAIQPPKPPAEMKKFDAWTGTWSYEGEGEDSPLGPGGKITGKAVGRPILNGFFFEWRYQEKNDQGVEIDWYDSAAKTYRAQYFKGNGHAAPGAAAWSGATWTGERTRVNGGTEYRIRDRMILAADGKSSTESAEISPDGKTWKHWFDCKYTKVSDQPDLQVDQKAPNPQPQMKALEPFMGTWKTETEDQATPLGPAGKHSWMSTGRWILNGFFCETKTQTDRNEHWLEIDWYDPVAKSYRAMEFDDDGKIWSGTFVMDGARWTGSSVVSGKGAELRFRSHGVLSDDKKTSTAEAEFTEDGKNWKPVGKAKGTKVTEP